MSEPTLFDLPPDVSGWVWYDSEHPFEWKCSLCHQPVTGDDYVGGTRNGRGYLLCGRCAALDNRADGINRYGITERSLEIGRIRRKVYAAGGGETEVATAIREAGLA